MLAIMAIVFSIVGNISFSVFSKQLWLISNNTNQIIQGTLIVNLIGIVLFSLVFAKVIKLKLTSFFLDKKSVFQGIKAVIILWCLIQIILIATSFFMNHNIELENINNNQIGSFISQLFGNALFEEFVYRGFFLIQLFLIFKVKLTNKKALLVSIILSQLIFALIHIPNRIIVDLTDNLLIDTVQVFIGGIIGALIFIRTKNLIFLIGFHALANVPINLIKPTISIELLTLIIGISIAIFWNKLKLNSKFKDFWQLKSNSKFNN